MNILVLNYEYPPVGGGAGVAAASLSQGWSDDGHNVDVLTSSFAGLKKEEKQERIRIYRVKAYWRKDLHKASFKSIFSYLFFAFFKIIWLRIKGRKYDLVNTHFVLPTGPLGYFASILFNCPNILSIHEADIFDETVSFSPHNRWYCKKVINFLFKKANVVVAQSSYTKNNAIKYYRLDKEIVIIPLPYKFFAFKKKPRADIGMRDNGFYLVTVGRLVRRKNFNYIIESMERLSDDIFLHIVGDGPRYGELEQQIKNSGLNARVKLTGYIDNDLKYQYLQNSDVYVLGSLHEGFGIVLQEAMQVGLPIVSTYDGGQSDFLVDQENALYIEVKSSGDIAAKVMTLYKDKKLREELSKNNLKKIKTFSLKYISRRYLKLINKQ